MVGTEKTEKGEGMKKTERIERTEGTEGEGRREGVSSKRMSGREAMISGGGKWGLAAARI